MDDLFNAIYVEGDILQTCIRLFILFLACDCIFGFGHAIASIKGAVS